jgi:hypothetical protein
MTIAEVDKKIHDLQMERAELEFKKEFKGLKMPKIDFMQLARVGSENRVESEARLQYELVMKDMLYKQFQTVKRTCWKYWLKKNPIKKKVYDQ